MASTVVITGASAGIGRATARLFAQRGADLALLARGEAGLRATAAEVEELGGRALTVPTDMADDAQVEAAAAAAEAAFGPIDVWVNVAFTSVFSSFVDIEPDEYRRVTEVTYLGFVNGTRSALGRMLPRDRGTVVQVGSALGGRSVPLQSAYCGAKHAINGFTSSIRTELLHQGSNVHVTVVQMPAVNTPQFSWVLSRLQQAPSARPTDLPAGGGRPGGAACRGPSAPQAVLRRRLHNGHPLGEQAGRSAAGPLSGTDRLRLAAE